MRRALRAAAFLALTLAGCNGLTDPATRLANDLEAASDDLADEGGGRVAVKLDLAALRA